MFSNDNSQIRFLRAVAVTSFGTIQSGLSAIPNVFELEKENQLLRENNIKLSYEISTLRESKLENIRLTKLLNFKDKIKYDFVLSKIVSKSLIHTRNTITLNCGEADGVKIYMPVIVDDGLVGRVIAISKNYSIAQILFNKDLKISVKSQRSRVDGILFYSGTNILKIANIPKNADVNVGDVFITSEYSNNFPPGIPVGTVIETGNLDNLFKEIILIPQVKFESLEEVFILKCEPDTERNSLEKSFIK